MINYLGCEKRECSICFSTPDKIKLKTFKRRIIEAYAVNVPEKQLKNAKGIYLASFF